MDKNTALIIWTIIGFVFIAILCFIFQNGNPLWLLIFWLLGFDEGFEQRS